MAKKKEKEKTPARADQERNAASIRDAVLKLLKQNKGRTPTFSEIAKETGLHYNTVANHWDKLDFMSSLSKGNPLKALSGDVLLGIYKSAMNGSAASQKLWFQIVEGWNEKKEIDHSGKIETTPQPPTVLNIGKLE